MKNNLTKSHEVCHSVYVPIINAMKTFPVAIIFALAALPVMLRAQASLTIYNQNFAVVRDQVPLDLKAGENVVPYTGVTTQLEPDSVVLRDPAGKAAFRILNQSYRADTLSVGYMLQLNEGKTIDFIVKDKDNKEYTIQGKIIRSGFTPGAEFNSYEGDNPRPSDQTPIIEVGEQLRFSLPGEPVFPKLADDTVLKPTLTWRLGADAPAKFNAELSYITNGLSWDAAYNLIAPEKSDTLDFVGWVTFQNNSGKEFTNATVKLMAGNVNKIEPPQPRMMAFAKTADAAAGAPPVSEKAFDEFHLYTLAQPVTLHDHETQQVEFIRATNVKAQTLYVYDGAALDNFRGWDPVSIRSNPEYGTQSNKKVWVMREFKNTKENGLGIALPAGRVRFYRSDDSDHSVQFVGENTLDHTPEGELVRMYTGDAFDLVGERKRVDYQLDNRNSQATESFAITLRNHKKEPVEIRVVEHLYRWTNWEITDKSDDFTKTDAQTIEFRVTLQPDEEKTITYKALYDWR
jgi:hypothetical protein